MKSRHAAFWLILAALAFFAMSASSPQCARSSDQVTGPSLTSLAGGPNACQNQCKADRRLAIRVERKRHRLADKACNGDAQCHIDEDALHLSNLAQIEADYQDCLDACAHQQGSALGGQ
jgi:hypothetical protein